MKFHHQQAHGALPSEQELRRVGQPIQGLQGWVGCHNILIEQSIWISELDKQETGHQLQLHCLGLIQGQGCNCQEVEEHQKEGPEEEGRLLGQERCF